MLNLYEDLQERLVRGENVGQAYGLVSSGNADIGFIALAQHLQQQNKGSSWLVDETLHTPIRRMPFYLTVVQITPLRRRLLLTYAATPHKKSSAPPATAAKTNDPEYRLAFFQQRLL